MKLNNTYVDSWNFGISPPFIFAGGTILMCFCVRKATNSIPVESLSIHYRHNPCHLFTSCGHFQSVRFVSLSWPHPSRPHPSRSTPFPTGHSFPSHHYRTRGGVWMLGWKRRRRRGKTGRGRQFWWQFESNGVWNRYSTSQHYLTPELGYSTFHHVYSTYLHHHPNHYPTPLQYNTNSGCWNKNQDIGKESARGCLPSFLSEGTPAPKVHGPSLTPCAWWEYHHNRGPGHSTSPESTALPTSSLLSTSSPLTSSPSTSSPLTNYCGYRYKTTLQYR